MSRKEFAHVPALAEHQLSFLIQFIHPEKTTAFATSPSDAMLAPFFGIDVETYRRRKQVFVESSKRAAAELLDDAAVANRVDRLPFSGGATVVALGDSITDDYQSWTEILRHLLALRRPNDGIRVINAGISGDTTTHIIARFLAVAQANPEWILCLAGTNDCRRHGLRPTKPMVSIEETAKNFAMLRNFSATQTKARWFTMTPPTAINEMIVKHWFLGPMQLSWEDRDLAAVADVIRGLGEPYGDLRKLFGTPADKSLLQDDGLHPSLAGQKAIARAVVEGLAA